MQGDGQSPKSLSEVLDSLYDPAGDTVRPLAERFTQSAWIYNRDSGGAILLKRTRTYRLVYGLSDTAAWSSRLTLVKHPWPNETDPEGGLLVRDELRSGTLSAGDMDSYFFEATEGDTVGLSLTRASGSVRPAFYVLDPRGQALSSVSGDTQALIENRRISATGLYLVSCFLNPGLFGGPTSGNYTLLLTGSIRSPASTRLYLRRLQERHWVFWVDPAAEGILEASHDLNPNGWFRAEGPTTTVGGMRSAVLPNDAPARLYRLARPRL